MYYMLIEHNLFEPSSTAIVPPGSLGCTLHNGFMQLFFFRRISEPAQRRKVLGEHMVINIVAIVIGIIACLFGYKALRIWLAIVGLVLGAALGYYLGGLIGEQVWPIIGAIVVGLLVSVISFFIYRIGAILIGALLGGAFTSIVLSAFGVTPLPWMVVAGAVVVAIIAGIFLKQFIIIGSSFHGAYLIVAGAYALIVGMSIVGFDDAIQAVELPWYIYAIIVVLGIVAVILQNKIEKKAPKAVQA